MIILSNAIKNKDIESTIIKYLKICNKCLINEVLNKQKYEQYAQKYYCSKCFYHVVPPKARCILGIECRFCEIDLL